MAEEIYSLQVPMSAEVLALGWAAFAAIAAEIGYWYGDSGPVELEYRHHGDWPGGGVVTTFWVRRAR